MVAKRSRKSLGVPVDYLIDDTLSFPFEPIEKPELNGPSERKMKVSREERAFLEVLRASSALAKKVAFELPHSKLGAMLAVYRVLLQRKHS
jgi:hypothetical protein